MLKEARDEAFLEAAVAAAGQCGKQGCKKSVKTMGSVCKYCNLKFCFEHAQAEVHGCGQDASKSERAEHKRSARAGQSNLSAVKREGIAVAHKKKMEKMASSRKGKGGGSSGGK